MTHFISFIRASLAIAVAASIVYSSSAATQYVNGATIFGRCGNFAIQAGTAISFDGVQTTVNTGNVGVSPGTSITGSLQLGTGYTRESNTISTQNCAADELTAYGSLKGLNCTNTLVNSDLAGVTLTPGVYCSTSGVFTLSAGSLSLDAQGDASAQFIFQTTTTVITAASTNMILLNGAMAKNVYWQVGSSATLGGGSSFVGQILADVSITVDTGVSVVGRLYAEAAVTCASAANITLPTQC
uniref:Ice-binding family protein n=1 Tax=Adineta environmental sample TaxID=1193592 RepID=A0AAU7VF50_9BILA